jgi:hypothetical protein
MLYDKVAIPSILVNNTPVTDQETYIPVSGLAFRINIQPESPMVTSLGDGELFATYHFFTAYSGLQAGWRLTISGSSPVENYIVKGINKFNYGAGQHYEGTLAKDKQ